MNFDIENDVDVFLIFLYHLSTKAGLHIVWKLSKENLNIT